MSCNFQREPKLAKSVLRNFTGTDGKRTGIRLDAVTWKLVDQAASDSQITWQQWVSQIVAKHPDATTMTSVVRAAVMDYMLTDSIIRERAEAFAQGQHPLFAESSLLNDEQLATEMRKCAPVTSTDCLGGFTLHVGNNDYGQMILFIENGLKDSCSVALILNPKNWS